MSFQGKLEEDLKAWHDELREAQNDDNSRRIAEKSAQCKSVAQELQEIDPDNDEYPKLVEMYHRIKEDALDNWEAHLDSERKRRSKRNISDTFNTLLGGDSIKAINSSIRKDIRKFQEEDEEEYRKRIKELRKK